MSILIQLVDDHAGYLSSLARVIESNPGFRVCAQCPDGASAIREVHTQGPDVILMDIQMPGMSGIEATRAIYATHPHIAILMLTMVDDDDAVFAAMRAGARGYLLKGATRAELFAAIQSAHAGDAVFGAPLARRMAGYFAHASAATTASRTGNPALSELTERERDVLEHLARGAGTDQIAKSLSITSKTVRNHISSIFAKLQVADRVNAVLRARDEGLLGS